MTNPYWKSGEQQVNTAHDFLYSLTWLLQSRWVGGPLLHFIDMIQQPPYHELWLRAIRADLKAGRYENKIIPA